MPHTSLRGTQLRRVLSIGLPVLALLIGGGAILVRQQSKAVFINRDQHGGFIEVPTNLRVNGVWVASAKAATDTLVWDATPHAASYNIYQNDVFLASTSSTSFTVPVKSFNGSTTYYVTAVNKDNVEGIPSNIARSLGAPNPDNPPTWTNGDAPAAPTKLTTFSEWNLGVPRIELDWQHTEPKGIQDDKVYNVYRDGKLVAAGMTVLRYVDSDVAAGSTHSYEVTAVKTAWPGNPESAKSASVSATALSAPVSPSPTAPTITGVQENDDSAVITFTSVPGAVDYRAVNLTTPFNAKYAGIDPASSKPADTHSIEVNGLKPGATFNFVIEALDKLGPFQKMDGAEGPGGAHSTETSGMGDPSNVPNVLSQSQVVRITPEARSLTGSQAFFDTFRGNSTLTKVPVSDPGLPASTAFQNLTEYQNANWKIRFYNADEADTQPFIMSNHFMDTLYDGPSPFQAPFSHNNNASTVMLPKQTADISGDKVLHVTAEVDAHFDPRRWVDIVVYPKGDTFLDPQTPFKFGPNTLETSSGKSFLWEINAQDNGLFVFNGKNAQGRSPYTEITDRHSGIGKDSHVRSGWQAGATPLNGTTLDLDKRHTFDLFLSSTRAQIYENGRLMKDTALPQSMDWSNVQVGFVHELYHTGNDLPELINFDPNDSYWYNNRPWADERHWDNMGFEVLNDFSQAKPSVVAMSAPVLGGPAPTPTATPSDAPVVQPTMTMSMSPSSSPTPTPTAIAKATATPTAKASATPTASPTGAPTPPKATPTATPTIVPSPTPTATPTPKPLSQGLEEQLYVGGTTKRLVATHTGVTVPSFSFGSLWGTPDWQLPHNGYSMRWTGYLTPTATGLYSFDSYSDDGFSLTIGGRQLINDWNDHSLTHDHSSVNLRAGVAYPITVEYYQDKYRAQLGLYWTPPGQRQQSLIPRSVLSH